VEKIITAVVDDNTGNMIIDLGGELDKGCCGCPTKQLHEELSELGVELECIDVHCRLPIKERIAAKLGGICPFNPFLQSERLADFREKKFEV